MSRDPVMIGIASIPERVGSLKQTIGCLAPQADRVFVALNDYETVPDFLARYDNVEAWITPEANGGDAEKFAAVDDWDGYVLTCDDDIGYPPDYVRTLVAGIDRYDRERAASFHGGTTLGWDGSAVAASGKRIRCLNELARDDTEVNVVGTGVTGYHTSRIPVWRDVFVNANMADVGFACHGRLLGIPMVCLAHKAGWLRDICPPLGQGRRIYTSNRTRDGSRCDTHVQREQEIRRFDWLAPAPGRPTVRVTVTTCGRPEKLLEVLQDLVRESQWADLEVAVYEDPAGGDYAEAMQVCETRGWVYHRFDERHGRDQHWRLVDRELRDARDSDAGWFLFMPDDVRLVRHAIPRAISTWDRLADPATLTMWRLASLEGRANWTGKPPVGHDFATETFHVDGFYLARRDTLATLGFECGQPRHSRRSGSGVGMHLSKILDAAGKRMYRVDSSLGVSNDDGVSLMNPEERRRHPAITLSGHGDAAEHLARSRPVSVAACLVWFDEEPDSLARCVSSLAGLCSHLVAVDGRWQGFPADHDLSSNAEVDAIRSAAAGAGVKLKVVRPSLALLPFASQVAKRNVAVKHATRTGASWMLVIDGDERLENVNTAGVLHGLATTARDVAWVGCRHDGDGVRSAPRPIRRLYRLSTRPSVAVAHNGYVTEDGRWLHGDPSAVKAEPAENLSQLVTVVNDLRARSDGRMRQALAYRAHRRRFMSESWRREAVPA